MSKKKRRYEKYESNGQKKSSQFDTHHLCYIRRDWDHGYAQLIRQFHYCTISIPKATMHKFIHDNLVEIPVPSELAAEKAYEQLLLLDKYGALGEDDPLGIRLLVLASLFDCIAQPTADGFRKQFDIVQSYNSMPP